MNKSINTLALALTIATSAIAKNPEQTKNKANYIDYNNEFWGKITKSVEDFGKKKDDDKKKFYMDFTNVWYPKSIDDFQKVWYNPPVSQGSTNTCWCFSSTSFLESEAYRIHKKSFRISEMYTVYWEYVEKTKRFIRERGNSSIGEGSQANAVFNIWGKYGCVPLEEYSGLKEGQEFHSHDKMFQEINAYLQNVKATNAWNEDGAVETIKSIMNHYMGVPPTTFNYEGKQYDAKSFLKDQVKLDMKDYVSFMSLMRYPYFAHAEYKVPDNWWKCADYNNVPLDDFMSIIKNVLKKGYSIAIGGDVSESGYYPMINVAMIPTYDIPSEYIDENARQLRFDNGSTTDDHGVHIIGYLEKDGVTWFAIKDSGSGSRNGTSKGYYFWHQDYVKLKMMNFSVHRSAVEDILKKIK
jgi:bleomycin hydrolase